VFPLNEPSLLLYASFGFERAGYRKRHYERGGELVDAILMAYFVDG
jgi:RimJ/RimL family protein N-acetyltransferase